ARALHSQGAPLVEAIVDAASARFRPIVMTSAAFLLGVTPLLVSSGAGAESRRSIGTGVFGAAITAPILGLVFTPLAFYAVVSMRSIWKRTGRRLDQARLRRGRDEAPSATDFQG